VTIGRTGRFQRGKVVPRCLRIDARRPSRHAAHASEENLDVVWNRQVRALTLTLRATDRWSQAHPGAMVGAIALQGVENPTREATLEVRAEQLRAELLQRLSGFDRAQLASQPGVKAYVAYYKRFGKTYHLLLQLESILLKDKAIAAPNALVLAMLMAEMKNMLLTAGHDLTAVQGNPVVDVADGTETYPSLGGRAEVLKKGDMLIRDDLGILSSILYGPDQRTRIGPKTEDVVYLVYGPPGVSLEAVEGHLADLEANVGLFSPNAELCARQILVAADP